MPDEVEEQLEDEIERRVEDEVDDKVRETIRAQLIDQLEAADPKLAADVERSLADEGS